MAKILDKDPVEYVGQREAFIRELHHFHDTRGTPFRKPPLIGEVEVDLFLLYHLVTAKGGWVKLTNRNEWNDLVEHFKLPSSCVNIAVALKQIYMRYLDRYEKVHFLGEDADRGSEDDEASRHKRWSVKEYHSVPLTYNHHQHNIAETTRAQNGLSTDLHKPTDYDRLMLCLVSPLPNEQDFAINTCTLLSNEGKHHLKLEKCPRLIDYLLAHAGVFNHHSLRPLFQHVYSQVRCQPLVSFWPDCLTNPLFDDLTDETKFIKRKTILPVLTRFNSKKETDEQQPIIIEDTNDDELFAPPSPRKPSRTPSKVKLKIEPGDRDLFCVARTLGTQEYVGQRVLQVANILRNLSFTDDNMKMLANNITFLRFLLLCSNARWNTLHQYGFDMLSNIALQVSLKDPVRDRLSECLLITVTEGISSNDRFVVMSCLDVLNKLSQNEANEDVLLRYLEQNVYQQVCLYLSIQDIMLLIYTLECLYSLTSLGERACNRLGKVRGVYDTLVSLVTVEAQSYGPKACIGMKVVETVPPGTIPNPTPQSCPQPTPSSQTPPPPLPTSSTSVPMNSPNVVTPIYTSATSTPTPRPPIQVTPRSCSSIATSVPTPVVVQQVVVNSKIGQVNHNVQQQHVHQQTVQENEQFALAWLRANFEPDSNGKIEQQELYRNYLTSCSKIGRKGVIAPLHFPRCVRSTFGGTVGPNLSKADSLHYYEGIKTRVQPLLITTQQVPVQNQQQAVTSSTQVPPNATVVKRIIVNKPNSIQVIQKNIASQSIEVNDTPPQSPASPILKAQLSSSLKKDFETSQVSSHPHLSQALLAAGQTPGGIIAVVAAGNGSNAVSSSSNLVNNIGAASGGGNNGKELSNTSVNILANLPNSIPQNSSSLIKSLLATKVTNDCMSMPMSMRTTSVVTTECPVSSAEHVASVVNTQVTQRQQQQRILAQQIQQPVIQAVVKTTKKENCRINGSQNKPETEISTLQISQAEYQSVIAQRNSSRTPQPIPPPLAPLSCGKKMARINSDSIGLINDDSNSLGNISIASNSQSQVPMEDGESSLTSFEGLLLNGIPNSMDIDNPSEDSNSNSKPKSLMLADLLEKKMDKKEPPAMNGVLRIGDKGLELVENHIEKVLMAKDEENNLKRPAEDQVDDVQAKRQCPSVIVSNVNGSTIDDNVDSPSEDGEVGSVSSTAANLYAALAADVLDEEDLEEEIPPEIPAIVQPQFQQIIQNKVVQTPQPLIMANRQIIVSQPQVINSPSGPMIITAGSQFIQQNQQKIPMLVQTAQQQQPQQPRVVFSQMPQGLSNVQFVGATQSGQYVISSNNAAGQTTYVMAQPQTAIVQGQTQTVLVAQTSQQGSPAKTIIILQPQNAQPQQKVVMTSQGQQVVMTQVARPVVQSATPQTQQVIVQQQQPQTTVITSTASIVKGMQSNFNTVTPQTNNQVNTVVVNKAVAASTFAPTVAVDNSVTKVIQCNQKQIVDNKPVVVRNNNVKPVIKSGQNITDSVFVCEWKGCISKCGYRSANEVLLHAVNAHCPNGSDEIICQWERCDNMKRKRFSLMTHLIDRHCNAEAMKQSAVRRKQMAQSGRTDQQTPAVQPQHPGYAPDAALHAIKRHTAEYVNPKELLHQREKQGICSAAALLASGFNEQELRDCWRDENEGPVTKSIRLTASLILRNLVIYSHNSRRFLRHYEPHLASVAMSNVESSRTIAQVLFDLNDGSSPHR